MIQGVPCFIVIHRSCVVHKSKAYGNPVLSKSSVILSSSICSLCVSHFGNSRNTSNFFVVIIFLCGLWCYSCNCLGAPKTTPITNLIDNVCVLIASPAVQPFPIPIPLFGPPLPCDTTMLRLSQLVTPEGSQVCEGNVESPHMANFIVVFILKNCNSHPKIQATTALISQQPIKTYTLFIDNAVVCLIYYSIV